MASWPKALRLTTWVTENENANTSKIGFEKDVPTTVEVQFTDKYAQWSQGKWIITQQIVLVLQCGRKFLKRQGCASCNYTYWHATGKTSDWPLPSHGMVLTNNVIEDSTRGIGTWFARTRQIVVLTTGHVRKRNSPAKVRQTRVQQRRCISFFIQQNRVVPGVSECKTTVIASLYVPYALNKYLHTQKWDQSGWGKPAGFDLRTTQAWLVHLAYGFCIKV